MNTKYRLSVGVITYNHEKYIRKCLDGIINQKTNFPFQVLINDDASTDGTADIIREYEKNYPDIIKPVYQETNQYCKGQGIIANFIFPRVNTEYFSLCEGDDYWTDPYKLQKQVDFLDNNPDYSIVFHPAKIVWENGEHKSGVWGPNPHDLKNLNEAIWHNNLIPTLSVMYRWRLHGENIKLWPAGIAPADWYLHLLHAQVGKIGIISEIMGVYRKHSRGIWYNEGKTEDFFLRNFWPRIYFCENAKQQFDKDFYFIELKMLADLFKFCQKQKNFSLVYKLRDMNINRWKNLVARIDKYLKNNSYYHILLGKLAYKLTLGQMREKNKWNYHILIDQYNVDNLKKELPDVFKD